MGKDKDAGIHFGPVKTAGRMIEKLKEYVNEGKEFPRAPCIIDILRLSVAFDSGDQIFAAWELLEKNNGNGYKLVRYKNKYSKKFKKMPFRNLMINVQIEHTTNGHTFPIIAELQLTTLKSIKLKKIQHKLYK